MPHTHDPVNHLGSSLVLIDAHTLRGFEGKAAVNELFRRVTAARELKSDVQLGRLLPIMNAMLAHTQSAPSNNPPPIVGNRRACSRRTSSCRQLFHLTIFRVDGGESWQVGRYMYTARGARKAVTAKKMENDFVRCVRTCEVGKWTFSKVGYHEVGNVQVFNWASDHDWRVLIDLFKLVKNHLRFFEFSV